jgi:hypothetical protein
MTTAVLDDTCEATSSSWSRSDARSRSIDAIVTRPGETRRYDRSMSFQAYLRNIEAKTGKSLEDLRDLAQQAGVLKQDLRAEELVGWLTSEFGVGRGHSMAVWNVFVSNGWVETKHTRLGKGSPG